MIKTAYEIGAQLAFEKDAANAAAYLEHMAARKALGAEVASRLKNDFRFKYKMFLNGGFNRKDNLSRMLHADPWLGRDYDKVFFGKRDLGLMPASPYSDIILGRQRQLPLMQAADKTLGGTVPSKVMKDFYRGWGMDMVHGPRFGGSPFGGARHDRVLP